MNKQELRKKLLAQRAATPLSERKRIDRKILESVKKHPRFRDAKTIFVYYSVGEEIDTRCLIAEALAQGKRVCVPKCLPGRRMEPRYITSENDLTEQTYGIPEPGSQCPAASPKELDLCIVPALACAPNGVRLGYGGGYYDRFLAQTDAFCMELCAHCRLLGELPAEEHDIPCDCIVTDREVVQIHEG